MDFETHPVGTAAKLQRAFESEQDSIATIDALVQERAVLLTALHEIKGMHHWQADRPLMAIVRKAIEKVTAHGDIAPKPDCGEAGHTENRCGNAACLQSARVTALKVEIRTSSGTAGIRINGVEVHSTAYHWQDVTGYFVPPKQQPAGVRCHGDACCGGQLPCPTRQACGLDAPPVVRPAHGVDNSPWPPMMQRKFPQTFARVKAEWARRIAAGECKPEDVPLTCRQPTAVHLAEDTGLTD